MEDLPNELIAAILSYLDPVCKLKTALVNRRFSEIASDSLIHRFAVFKSKQFLPEKFIISYIKRYGSSLHQLSLQDHYWVKLPTLSAITMCCGSLTCLDLSGCVEIPVQMVFAIFKQNPNIRHFGWTVGLELLKNLKNLNLNQGRHALEQVKALSIIFEDLESLKINLFVYPMSIYKDGFEPEAVLFTNVISRVLSPRLQRLNVTCLDRGLFMSQPKLSRVVLQFCVELKELIDTCNLSSVELQEQFAEARMQIATNAISPHSGIIKGWIKYLLVQKSHTIKTLAVAGPPFLNFWIPLLGNGLRMCDITTLDTLDISFCHDVPVYWMASVLRGNSLRILNVSHMECVTGELLKVLADGSPHLEFLNLQGCHDCLEPIDGLKSVAKKCTKLQHLNLGGIHFHATKGNELLEVLSTIKNLQAVSLSGCSMVQKEQDVTLNTCVDSPSEDGKKDNGVGVAEEKEGDSDSSFDDSDDDDSDDSDECESVDTDIDEDDSDVSDNVDDVNVDDVDVDDNFDHADDGTYNDNAFDGDENEDKLKQSKYTDSQQPSFSGLELLVHHCHFLRHVELINPGFHSVLRKGWITSRPPLERSHLIFECPDQQSEMLEALALCTSLESLTIAGYDIRSGLEFLVKIACSCSGLKLLSLAQLRGLEMSILPTLTLALAHCTSLRTFRFEQSYFAVPESLIMALSNAANLEALCMVTKGGSIAVSSIIPLFEQCLRLRVLQVCADASSCEETFRNLTSILNNKYASKRAGLAISLFPYDSNTRNLHDKLLNHAHEMGFPLVHLNNLSLFSSQVATCIT